MTRRDLALLPVFFKKQVLGRQISPVKVKTRDPPLFFSLFSLLILFISFLLFEGRLCVLACHSISAEKKKQK